MKREKIHNKSPFLLDQGNEEREDSQGEYVWLHLVQTLINVKTPPLEGRAEKKR